MSCGLLRSLDDVALIIANSGNRARMTQRKRALAARIQHHLIKHAGKRLRLVEVGRAVGASPGYVSEVFREIVGVAPYRYQLELRLARARELLTKQSDLAGLALELGFSSHSHFTTAFRQRFGDTPASFRARVRRERAVRNAPPTSQVRAAMHKHRGASGAGSNSQE